MTSHENENDFQFWLRVEARPTELCQAGSGRLKIINRSKTVIPTHLFQEDHMSLANSSKTALRLLSLLAFVSFIVPINAQVQEACLQGAVADPAPTPIAVAKVTAIPIGSSTGPSTESDQAGEFSLLLEPGTYALSVTAEGFEDSSQTVKLIGVTQPRFAVMLTI